MATIIYIALGRHIVIFFFFVLFVCYSYAQDSLKNEVRYFYENVLSNNSVYYEDTTLNNFHYYLNSYNLFFSGIGNTGSPSYPLYYSYMPEAGFVDGIRVNNHQIIKRAALRYYIPQIPYTKALFINGSKKEQLINVEHSQKIAGKFYAGFDLKKINSNGFYLYQQTNHTQFSFRSNYETNNRKFGFFTGYVSNKFDWAENGGIRSDSLFAENFLENKNLIPVYLSGANNFSKSQMVFAKNYLNFGKKDSLYSISDSLYKSILVPKSRLVHDFSFERKIHSYKDNSPDSLYYSLFFKPLNDSLLFDSIVIKKLENTVSFNILGNSTKIYGNSEPDKFFLDVSLKNQLINYTQNIGDSTKNAIDTIFSNNISSVTASYHWLNKIETGIELTNVLSGYNQFDYIQKAYLNYSIDSLGSMLYLNVFKDKKHPEVFQSFFQSNQTSWNNVKFNNDVRAKGIVSGLYLKQYKFNFNASYYSFSNYIYYGIYGKPVQAKNSDVGLFQLNASKTFSFWKFNYKTNIAYQKVNGSQIIRVPELLLFNSFYYQSHFFKRNLYAQFGFDVFYHSSYFGNGYSPVFRQFYLQNERQAGNYPFIDFFFCFKISRARVFFKITHLNSGFSGANYALIPGYPMPDRAFRFGIDWVFWE